MAKLRILNRGNRIEIETPVFRTEAEEAEWWYRNRGVLEELLFKRGEPVGKGVELEVELKPVTKAISLRLPVRDIERARKLAVHRGLKYQTYIRALVHEGLGREEKRVASGR